MRILDSLRFRWDTLFRRDRLNAEMEEELRAHIQLRADDLERSGLPRADAERRARIEFGGQEKIKEECHEAAGGNFGAIFLQDMRFAWRVLRKSPSFTITAILTLGLAVGANVFVFGVLNAVLLRQLDARDPQNLYQIRPMSWMSGRLLTTSYPAFEDFRERNTTFSGMSGIYGYSSARLNWRNAVMMVHGDEVTGNYFDVLGVRPESGRFFHAADEHGPDSAPFVVLSDALWRSAFHSDGGVVGTIVELNKHPFTVIGVAGARFHGTERFVWPDYWVPMANEGQVEGWDYLHSRTSIAVTVIGRLKPGATQQQATDNLNAIATELAREYPKTDDGLRLRLIHPGLYGDDGDVIRGFLLSVILLALLVLSAALGARRRQVMRAAVGRPIVLLCMGALLGLGCGMFATRLLSRLIYGASPRDPLVLAGVVLVMLLLGLVATWIPAQRALRVNPLILLREE